jgi:L-ascorbate metabolism protein UlaG (beta-lactamase superfamily)
MNIQRLNMDNSWRLEFGGKSVLIDPWLMGVEVDYFSWFNTQWHKTAPVPKAGQLSNFLLADDIELCLTI